MGKFKFYVVFWATLFLLPLHFNVKAQSLNADTIIYVKAAGAGSMDGSSWDNAMASLSDALDSAYNWNQENRTITSIWVAEGTYYGNTDNEHAAFEAVPFVNVYGGFVGNEPANYDLSLRDFSSHPTILDGQHTQRVVYGEYWDWEAEVLPVSGIWDGFVIQNGYAGDWDSGSGVYFVGNFILSNSIIKNNGNESQGYYGGISIDGGALRNCQIYNNQAYEVGGIGAWNTLIENTLIAHNKAAAFPGFTGYACHLINCDIVNNHATDFENRMTGGINVEGEDMDGMRTIFENCIVWGNTCGEKPCQLTGECALFHHSAIEGEVVHGSNNIVLSSALCGELFSPCFADTAFSALPYGYVLQQNSICVNRGDNAAAGIAKDLAGQNRIRHNIVDMGCFESDYDAVQIPSFSGNIIYVVAGGRGLQTGQDWDNAMASLRQAAIKADLYHIPQIWVAEGLYEPTTNETGSAAFYMMPGINVYGGFIGNEPANYDLSQRNFEAHPTILSGAHRMRVLEQPGTFSDDKSATWSGFTLKNGWANGSGVGAKLYSNGNLEYCIIDSNYIEDSYYSRYGGALCVNQPAWITEDDSIDMNRNSRIDHCIIKNNFINGLEYFAMFARNAIISNTLIADNHSYGGAAVGLQNSQIINCDIVNNFGPEDWGTEIMGNDENCEIANSIVWNPNENITGIDYIDNIHHTASTESHSGTGNITIKTDNMGENGNYVFFYNPENGDYHLTDRSVCIDAGDNTLSTAMTDLGGKNRINGPHVDMGCYEYHGEQYCLVPTNLTITSISENSAYLQWFNPNSDATEVYQVQYKAIDSTNWITINCTERHTFISNLLSNTEYEAQVSTTCFDTIPSDFSSVIIFQTLESTGDCPRPNYFITNITDQSAVIEWPEALIGEQTEVQFKRSTDNEWTNQSMMIHPQPIVNLIPNMEYNIRVRTRCSATEFSEWNEQTFTTAPQLLDIIYVSQNGSGLRDGSSWNDATNDLQWAIDQAHSFHEIYGTHPKVYVAEGTYYSTTDDYQNAFLLKSGMSVYGGFAGNENEDFDLNSRDFAAHPTILDAENAKRVLYQSEYFEEEDSALWDGFTFIHGYTNQSYGAGCYILGNTILRNSIISDCYYQNGSWNGCEGIALYAAYDATVDNCEISNNNCWGQRYGNLIYIINGNVNRLIVRNNYLENNLIKVENSTLNNCLFANNTHSILFYMDINSKVVNSTIVKNKDLSYNIYHVLNHIYDSNDSAFVNCIFWENRDVDNVIEDCEKMFNCATEHAVRRNGNIVISRYNNDYYGPKFVNPSTIVGRDESGFVADWHLLDSSFCFNRGNGNYVPSSIDLDGSPRVQQGQVDLGCYESNHAKIEFPAWENDAVYVSETGSGQRTGTDWDNALSDLQMALHLSYFSCTPTVKLAEGTYSNDSTVLIISDGTHLVGGYVGGELEAGHFSTLDGQHCHEIIKTRYYYFPSDEYAGDTIHLENLILSNSGLQNYNEDYGSTLYTTNLPKARINNCIFTNNAWDSRPRVNLMPVVRGYGDISNCMIEYNGTHALQWVGKIENTTIRYNEDFIWSSDSIQFYNCQILNNKSSYRLNYYDNNYDYDLYRFHNCLIAHNEGPLGGILSGKYYNCDIVSNKITGEQKGPIYAKFYNSIIWGNRNTPGHEILNPSCEVMYSAIEGGFSGEGNIALSSSNDEGLFAPHFVLPNTSCGNTTVADGDWHLRSINGNCCINTGNNDYCSTPLDLDDSSRIYASIIDRGCYESRSTDTFNFPTYHDIVYVTPNGNGDGNSWQNATNDLQSAINIAHTIGADVWVATGTYKRAENDSLPIGDLNENLSQSAFYAKDGVNVYGGFIGNEPADFNLENRNWQEHPTILDGEEQYRILEQTVDFRTIPYTTWSGFIFHNGKTDGNGGAAYLQNRISIENAVFENNTALEYPNANDAYTSSTVGGAIYIDDNDTVSIKGCEFKNNTAQNGAAIYGNATAFIDHCHIHHNTAIINDALSITQGGGYFRNSIIDHNQCNNSILSYTGLMVNCNIVNNEVAGFHEITYYSNPIISIHNYRHEGYYLDEDTAMVNCIIWGNYGDSNVSQNDFNTSVLNQLTGIYANCAIENSVPGDHFINLAHENIGYTDTIHYVDFANPQAGDYRLCDHSVCTDHGLLFRNNDSLDFAGNPRIINNKIDIGAIERGDSCQHEQAAYGKIYYVSQYGSGDGSNWNNAMGNLQDAIDSAHLNYQTTGEMSMIWVAMGTYYGADIHKEAAFTLKEGASIYGSFAGYEPADYNLDNRDFMANPTILDGAERQRALMQPVSLTENASSIVDGFILQHGYTTGNGGGAYLGAHTQMYHCTIKNNIADGDGGGVYGMNGQYANCLFTNNESGNNGGGVYADNVVLVNCNIVKNKSGNEGAGIYSLFTSLLTNCVIWNNVSHNENSTYAGRQCIIYSAIEGGCPGEGNITLTHNNTGSGQLHPNFVKPSTVIGIDSSIFACDYALTDSSVLKNRGINVAAEDFNTDIRGQERIQRGTIDVGCYESNFDSIVPIYAFPDTIYVKAGGAGNNNGHSWDNACATLSDALMMASLRERQTTIWVAKGTYYGVEGTENAFVIPAHTNVFGGFVGNEPRDYNLSQRNFDLNECILSGNSSQRVLFQPDTFSNEDAVIWDGFTISHGSTTGDGAGAYIRDNCSLQHCEFSNNFCIGNAYSDIYGGGIYANATIDGRCVIKNCYIHNNASTSKAGGIFAKNTIIDSCTIAENSSNTSGGLHAVSSHVQDCVIEENRANYQGGAYSENSTFNRCKILKNISEYSCGGLTSGYNTHISNSLITNNSGFPGGVNVALDQEFTMINCDIVNNNSPQNRAGFGNNYVYYSRYYKGTIYLYNCIFWGNKNNYLPDLFETNNDSYFHISHCAFEGTDIAGDGNINLSSYNDGFILSQNYVRFNDPSHDNFTLHQSSICIDRGDASVVSDSLDLVHHTRIKGFDVEMGCYEVEVDSSCLPVTNVEVLDVQSAEVTLSWHPEGSEREWTILIHQEEEGIDTAVVADTIPFTFTGLPHNREYTAVVKARCDSSTTSVNSLPVYFFTTCDTASLTPIPDFANMRPADSTLIYYTHVDFYWEAMPEATSYNLYLWPADEPMPSNPQFFGLTNAWLENIALDTLFYGVWDYGKEFYWKVEAVNECISKESPVHNFQVDYLPDLHVTALTHSAATASQPMTVQWTVRNDGLGHTPPGESWSDYIWLSSNDQVLGLLSNYWDNHIVGWLVKPLYEGRPVIVDEALLATVECPSPLAPGEEYTSTATVSVPDTCLGTYFLYALSDQECTSKIMFDIEGDSLARDIIPIPYTPSLNGDPYYYLHSDYLYFYTTDTNVNGRHFYDPNETVRHFFPYAINSQIYEGDDYRNYDNFFYEKLQISTPPAPDFVISHIDHPTDAFTLDTINVNWTVSNIGNLAYEGEWVDAVYLLRTNDSSTLLNNETTILFGDSLLQDAVCIGTFNHFGYISPDSSLSYTHQVVIPNNTIGKFVFLVQTDMSDVIYESVKNDNNISSSGYSINITMTPPPDLTVRNIHFEPIASSDMDLVVDFDVVNIGAGATAEDYWEDRVLIQTGETFFISKFPHQGVLAPDVSYHVSANVHIPNNYSGIANVTVQTDADFDVFEYLTRENNNVRIDSALRIVNPDLVVMDITIRNQENIDRNHLQHVDITIANVGEGILFDKEISCVLYYDNELFNDIERHSLFVATTPHITLYPCLHDNNPNSRLPIIYTPSCTYTLEAEFYFPCEELSQHTLSVVVDYRNVAFESNEYNNHSDTFSIFNAEPDLTVEDINIINYDPTITRVSTEDNTLYTGDEIIASWNIINVGPAPMIPDPFNTDNDSIEVVDKIYISHYPNTYENGVLLGTYTHTRYLNVGESEQAFARFTLPNGFFGNCYLHVVTNTTQSVCEGANVTPNDSHSSVFSVVLRPYPDLTVASFELADTLIMGSNIQVDYTITNSEFATQSIAGFITDKIIMYMEHSELEIIVGSNTHYTNLNVNDSASYSFSCQIPNLSNMDGIWDFKLVTDANDDYYEYMYEDNNSKHISTVIKSYNFDLQSDTLIKTGSNPFRWGQEYEVKFIFENTTQNPSLLINCFNNIYLSQDDLYDSEDLLLRSLKYNNIIQANETIEQNFNITIPMGANEYSYLLAICNNEQNGRIPETDFNNNIFILPIHIEEVPVPDLAVSDVEILNSPIISGQEIRVAYTVTNVGTAELSAARWTEKFFLSADTNYSTSDMQIGNKACERSLQIGESFRDTANITIPLPNSGREHLLVYVNANSDFFEHNRLNNVSSSSISIRLPDPGDLIVTQIYCGDTIITGQNLSLNWKVQNIGEYVLAGNGLRSLVYISADTLFDATDRLLGEVVSDNIILPQNSMITQSLSTRVANIPEGNYYIIVKTNVSLNFYESNTRNNQSLSSRPVYVKMKALPFNTPVQDVLNNNVAEDYKITVGESTNETVRIFVQSDHTAQGAVNNIFVQHNDVANNLNFNYSTIGQNTSDAEVFIPSTQPDFYGVNVLGSTPGDTLQNITLEADILPLELININPTYGGNNGIVTVELTGSKFRDDMPVWLDNGQDTIHSRKLIFDNYYHAYAEFDLRGRDTGKYDVNILNFCDGIASLADTFSIVESIPEHLSLNLIIPQAIRLHHTIVLTLEFQNQGTADIVNPVVKLSNSSDCWLGLTTGSLGDTQTEVEIPLTIDGDLPHVLRPGAYGTVNIFCYTNSKIITLILDRVR